MRILIVSEGAHELGDGTANGALASLVARLLPFPFEFEQLDVRDRRLQVHRQPGEGRGYYKVAMSCLRFAQLQGFDALVFVVDEDGVASRRAELDEAQANTQNESLGLHRAIGLAVRTFDAWMLADEVALTKVLCSRIDCQSSPELTRNPKVALEMLIETGQCTLSRSEIYASVAREARLNVLIQRCPKGFAPFAERVRQLAPA